MAQDDSKRLVASSAAAMLHAWVPADGILGVGTGSTVDFFIDALATHEVNLRGAFSSSVASSNRLTSIGIEVLDANCGERAALYVDGADEVDRTGALTKGGGGALTREKIVAALSDAFLCLVDESKVVNQLGEFPTPIEVLPMAQAHVSQQLKNLGGQPRLREGFTTDNGNVILDVLGLDLRDPVGMEVRLNNIPGVVENGIFGQHKPTLTLVGCGCGIEARGSNEMLTVYADLLQNNGVCCTTSFD